ncbi:hypothetical protein CRG98_036322 [Punica granatum]|uniref:Uncharacterized protein n=1 Tax=Punica granatum TaxID=22663 RepID=A0A2I0IIT0_PUNGR|nr:hypothetical protein CRG98_036322 [Punica granatum]
MAAAPASSRSWPPLCPSRGAYSPLVDQRWSRAVLSFADLRYEVKTANEVVLGGRRGSSHPPFRSGKSVTVREGSIPNPHLPIHYWRRGLRRQALIVDPLTTRSPVPFSNSALFDRFPPPR